MKYQYILLVLALTLALSSASLANVYKSFKTYAQEYNKRYHSKAVEFYRFAIYLKNLAEIEVLNANPDDNALYGETQFTDLTHWEVREMMGLKVPKDLKFNYIKNYTNEEVYTPKQDTPDIWNWVQEGALSSVKDQGTCGSCWTYSTVGNIESLRYLKTKQMVDHSEQYLIDCDKSNFGCGGGWPYMAIDWLANHNGLPTLKSYPMRANYSGPCAYNATMETTKVKGYMNISHNETILKDALYETGPLSILLDFTGMMHYKAGVANPKLCGTWPDHALVLVGYGTKDEDYWLIKNSWGLKWGINGYLMLKRGASKCGIERWATTAILAE